MRAANLMTTPVEFRLWDKDYGKWADKKDVEDFCSIIEDPYGEDGEYWLMMMGRFKKLAYTGMNDKNRRKIFEGHIVRSIWKIHGRKIVYTGVICYERAEFVMKDFGGCVAILSAYEEKDLKIIGNIFENPELLKEEDGKTRKEG